MKKTIIIFLICIHIFATGCAFMRARDTAYYAGRDRDFSVNYDILWLAVTASVEARNEPINLIDKESGAITTDYVGIDATKLGRIAVVSNKILDPDYTDGRYRLGIKIVERPGEIYNVNIKAHIEGFQPSDEPYGWNVLESRGRLENELLTDIILRVGRQR